MDSAKLAGRASAEAAVAGAEPDGALAAPPDLTAAAFFDVDNTMMMGASLFHFARGMAARKFFTAADLAGFAWQQLKFRVGGRESAGDVQASREQALSFVAGRSVAELVELSEEIYDELLADRIWAGTRALAQMHLDAGQRVWLVTATPVELAQIIARRLGLTGALGTVAGHADGVYTGRLVGE
ncbi:MAG: HAD-IB family hydrolase, partial [Saccharopolyspora sp.]